MSGLLNTREKGLTLRDSNVWPLVRDILIGCPANAIRGMIPRGFVDYNRSYEHALEDTALRVPYETYHRNIECLLQTAIGSHGKEQCLLLDVHGFGDQPRYAPPEGYDIVLGTNNRSSIRYGEPDRNLAEFLASLGYRVFLPSERTIDSRPDALNGGFTTSRYSNLFGVNVIQIEIARKYRTKEGTALGKRLASDLAAFLSRK
ncbi:MAG TPA: N-formylglutamate amidohydrolase [Candidatus Fimivivens sp.]|nr:N-formylglutamate amidohydrolase [Candidatus Fimivivens sp.]